MFLQTSSASPLPKAGLMWRFPTISQQPQLPWLLCLSVAGDFRDWLRRKALRLVGHQWHSSLKQQQHLWHTLHIREHCNQGIVNHGFSDCTVNFLNDYPAVPLQMTPKVICSSLTSVLLSLFMKEQLLNQHVWKHLILPGDLHIPGANLHHDTSPCTNFSPIWNANRETEGILKT